MKPEHKGTIDLLGSKLSYRQVYGSFSDWVVWGGVMVVGPSLFLYGLTKFPFKNGNDPAFGYGTLICVILALTFMFLIRKRAAGPNTTKAYKAFIVIVAAFPLAMGLFGVFLILNGRFHWRI